MSEKKLWTVRDATLIYGIQANEIHTAINDGHIDYILVDGKRHVLAESFERWVNEHDLAGLDCGHVANHVPRGIATDRCINIINSLHSEDRNWVLNRLLDMYTRNSKPAKIDQRHNLTLLKANTESAA